MAESPAVLSDNRAPKVSVLMITYNHESYVAQAIESVLMQRADFPYELVIGEDCSSDRTREIVREYARKWPTLIRALLPEHNLGMHGNFRQVWSASRGMYVAMLEGDDYWTHPGKLQAQADLLDGHPETAICCARSVWRYEDGAQPDADWPDIPPGFYGALDVLKGNFLNFGSVMARRTTDRLPEWHRALHGCDIALYLTMAQYGNICLLPDVMSVYRIHQGGAWSRLNELDKLKTNRAMFQVFYENLDPKYRPAIREKLFWYSHDIAIDSFTVGLPGEVRACLHECMRRSGPLEHLREKAWLAFKGYCWWTFPIWRRLRRAWRSVKV